MPVNKYYTNKSKTKFKWWFVVDVPSGEYDKFGKDIVCSAVSCSSVGALNALENPKGFKIVIEDGYLELRNICDITKHDQIVIETLIIQLKSIEESYPKYIKVVEKGN